MRRLSEHEIAHVLIGSLAHAGLAAPVLVAGDATGDIVRASGVGAVPWLRRMTAPGDDAQPWPPAGPFAAGIVRLPKAKGELAMMLHAVASVTAPGAPILIYGANDEGIRSAGTHIEAVLADVTTVATRNHCRVIAARRPADIAGLKPNFSDWGTMVPVALAGLPGPFISYPGLFAHGRLDEGTALLVACLPEIAAGTRVTDFGCGIGVLGAAVLLRQPAARLTLVDNDALAAAAARRNVPAAQVKIVFGPGALAADSADLILTNPPIHDGRAEDHGVLAALIRDAARILRRGGAIVMVVQRRVPAADMLRAALGNCEELATRGAFAILRAVRS